MDTKKAVSFWSDQGKRAGHTGLFIGCWVAVAQCFLACTASVNNGMGRGALLFEKSTRTVYIFYISPFIYHIKISIPILCKSDFIFN